ncbi:MAG: DUF4097 family beta strand repeat protein [Gemmatimonadales bacterium]|nr:DUF4097 family beta strand repeat protein [Gemmatimonadales bacterium]
MPQSVRQSIGPSHLIAILLTAGISPAAAQQSETYRLAGARVAIYNLVGSARLEPGTGSDIVVEVRRGGADAAKLSVRTPQPSGGRSREMLGIVYPEDDIVYEPLGRGSRTTVQVGDYGEFDDSNDDDEHDWEDRRVTITGDGDGLHAHADLRILVPRGRDLKLHLAAGRVMVSNVKGTLKVETGAGEIEATGVRGRLALATGTGSVQASGFEGTELSIETGSGAVEASSLRGSDISVETGSGDISLAGVTAPRLSLSTGSGSITSDLGADTRDVSVETGSGNVTLRAAASLSAQLDIETGSGGIESDFPVAVTRHANDHMEGRIGDGRGRISVETGSGEVRLVRR